MMKILIIINPKIDISHNTSFLKSQGSHRTMSVKLQECLAMCTQVHEEARQQYDEYTRIRDNTRRQADVPTIRAQLAEVTSALETARNELKTIQDEHALVLMRCEIGWRHADGTCGPIDKARGAGVASALPSEQLPEG
jgi:alkylation response protein AidB-like acyl-CoA dehydrogenase